MKRRRQADLLVQANGLTDVALAVATFRHQHVALGLAYGGLGLVWLLSAVRQWRWHPRPADLRRLAVGLGLALLLLLAELLSFF
ncbi:hypothetical protein DAERI_020195 [Deinococcus aerius]|uniref:Uncharacterized protein n=2 Tax=Deinococcus TaxID=1298 RepID=A0A2I9DF09_9DEIO|nr:MULTISPECIES: hypothetical protein [Deinococcus]MBB5293944.1 hypothetical protein [Deinococcus metallilatus]QBY07482.1 hypothetical protein E5F05_05825 [Deinococcus metallilatus]RXJ14595.1 hypothetical protein ERJ73_02560 [Deinococcus metallilatus]TLK30715.1 hypothetical protein FCS05_02875 [Deinococcus metallilatus]GBF04598.1 hypothetical protein DAERI_020195 [Deinococcus aerius]